MPDLFTLCAISFWIAMIIDCVRADPDLTTWVWILILLNILGALLYFCLRTLPRLRLAELPYLKRWTLQRQIWTAEANARNIGKTHQYVALGNLLSEVGQSQRAIAAYQQALQQEPHNAHAHWGLSTIALTQKRLAIAQTHLLKLLQHNPEYRCGEASLLYGQVLFEMEDWNLARTHLEHDVKHWGHPESALRLAKILLAQGQPETAQAQLERLLINIRSAPSFHYRRHHAVIKQAEKLAQTLVARSR